MGYDPGGPNISAVHIYLGVPTGSGTSIVWTERPEIIKNGTVRVNWSLTSPDQASLSFQFASGAIEIDKGTPIKIMHDDAPRGFAGTIDKFKLSETPGTGLVRCEAQCVSWDRLLTKRRAWDHSYVNQTLGDIIASLVLNSLTGDNISAITIPGPVIDSFNTDYSMTVGDAIAQACQRASDDTDKWYVYLDQDGNLRNAKQDTNPAPWNVDDRDGSDGNALHGDAYQIGRECSLDKYCNVVLARAAKLITEPKTEQFTGDGATKTWNLTGPVALAPTVMLYTTVPVLSDSTEQTFNGDSSAQTFTLTNPAAVVERITVNGVEQSFSTNSSDQWYWAPGSADVVQNAGSTPLTASDELIVTYRWDTGETVEAPTEQTVGVAGVDTGKDWYWSADSNVITQDAGGAALTSTQSLSVTYQAYDVGYSRYVYGAAVDARATIEGGTGYYETYLTVDAPITRSGLDALTEAHAKAHGQEPEAVVITSNRPGLMTGQLITIHLDDIAADDDYLIDTMSLEVGEAYCYWQAHCIAGAMVGDVWSAWAALMRGGAGAGGGVPSAPSSYSDPTVYPSTL